MARAILAGDRLALARLITQVENRELQVAPVLRALYPHTGRAVVIGLTGPLGVGKSSLANSLLQHLRKAGKRVGVIGVDPSSPFSGGSVLGDRIRIDRDPADTGIFFRSMASRGHPGGLAAATREVVRLLDAFGMDVVLLETAGTGQVDVEIGGVASTNVVVLVPHLGDEVQSLKAGLFEIADVFCVNKSDLPGADGAARYLSELAGLTPRSDAWRPMVVQTSTVLAIGIEELWSAVEAHEAFLRASGTLAKLNRARLEAEVVELYRERVLTDALRGVEGS
ncbi:MAG: methylmalonyl Co-A mutase-associated GTPase MeaB, partial [Thermoplasmata archaeon]|nr:methylmalonyl Co-A mutase-associated GTPase MeaB [Thermoplasmata archaeon]